MVLIESDWNLNRVAYCSSLYAGYVLIESDWNLNYDIINIITARHCVLIESDWNLNDGNIDRFIREWEGINRIRLEFKFIHMRSGGCPNTVLIESDWNLNEDFSKLSLREANEY